MMVSARGLARSYTQGQPISMLTDKMHEHRCWSSTMVILLCRRGRLSHPPSAHAVWKVHLRDRRQRVGGSRLRSAGRAPSRRGVHDRWAPLGTWRGRHVGSCRERPGGHGHVLQLDAIAAAVIGGTSLSGGIGRITGTVIGTIILGIMTSGFTFVGLDAYIQDIVKGGVIVSAVVADRYRHRLPAAKA